MLRPANPSSAGSRVSAANITASTVTTAEKATPGTYGWFIVSMPSKEMTTVIPANTTDRPAVAIATDTAPLGVAPPGELTAVAGDDQQGVVDADAEADHRRDRARPIGHVDEVGEQRAAGQPDTDTEQCGGERKAHRDERPERDQQNDRGDEQAWSFGTDAGGLGIVDRLTGELDLHS